MHCLRVTLRVICIFTMHRITEHRAVRSAYIISIVCIYARYARKVLYEGVKICWLSPSSLSLSFLLSLSYLSALSLSALSLCSLSLLSLLSLSVCSLSLCSLSPCHCWEGPQDVSVCLQGVAGTITKMLFQLDPDLANDNLGMVIPLLLA